MSETKDALVVFMPSGRRGRFAHGTPLLDAARSLGVYVESVCGGRGLCGRCQVTPTAGRFAKHKITSSPETLSAVGDVEARYTRRRALPADRRLSCQARIGGDLVVDVPTDSAVNKQIVRKRAETRHIDRDPAVRLMYVEVAEPDMANPSGDLDRLQQALAREWMVDGARLDPPLLPHLQKVLRAGGWKVTAAIHDDSAGPVIIGLWPELRQRAFGLAVDIGSTTIAAHLVDLMSGRTVASAGTANPQVRFGEDLMSRVSYVLMNPDGLPALTEAVRGAVSGLIDKVAAEANAGRDDIMDATFVGNPVMHHIFLGLDPTELGGAPFALAVSGPVAVPAREIGVEIHPGARVYVLPCIAGHVGADAAAATLAEAPHRGEAITLLVDVGTNAEIVLGSRDRLLAASSPTGPAFEGAEISCGQRAAPGAIERVRIDPETLEPKIKVIGCDRWSDEPEFAVESPAVGVTGICGSGIVETIAEMFLAGIIDEDGVVDGTMLERSDRVVSDGRTFSYVLWREGSVAVRVTQTDVRAIQLAKAALYAGVRLLMDRLGVENVDRIRLAGAFGSYIDPKYAMVLGLIPDCALDQVAAVGNAAGTGARMALLNRGHRREVEKLVRDVEKIETAMEPKFQAHFVSAMAFPNKTEPFPRLAEAVALPVRSGPAAGDPPRRRGGRRRRTG
ncbi:ASKHA domain-containing protein [Minwuia thermotolerans]|uniref:Drug:proton antiporter n=1 Tax=Minwuia thermotolerans TaxID=2056226 RepID=A0A2M9FX87_9PROT|nr:ASKHA domain-containing protein [Minwuia thermotolerans]PJK28075.1 drug:proton antiporter [Minwuia thermotolerans]